MSKSDQDAGFYIQLEGLVDIVGDGTLNVSKDVRFHPVKNQGSRSIQKWLHLYLPYRCLLLIIN